MRQALSQRLFADVQLVLMDADSAAMAVFRDILRQRGFLRAVGTASLRRAQDLVSADLIDLVIGDADAENARFLELSRSARGGGVGPNPYVTTIGVTQQSNEANIRRMIDAGIDGILLKPFSVSALFDRISALVYVRRPFVVTTSYIGPDRRVRPRQESCLPLLDVPNTLRERVHGTYDADRIRKEIAATNRKVGEQRASQDAVLISQIVRQIAPLYETGQVDDTILVHLSHLLRTAKDMAAQFDSDADRHISGLCRSLVPIIKRILANHLAPDPKDIRLLQDVSRATFMALGDGGEHKAHSHDIAKAISTSKRYGHSQR